MKSLFDQISPKERKKIEIQLDAMTRKIPKNQKVSISFKENVIGLVLSGTLQIVKTDYHGNRTIIEELEEGHVFGSILSSLSNEEYSILAKIDSSITLLDYDSIFKFDSNTSYYQTFIKNLLSITTNLIEEKNNRIQILSQKTIRDKLLEYFKITSLKHGSAILYLPFSFTELADYLAVDRSAMYRELKHLKEEKFITIKGRKITLLYRYSFSI